MQHIYLDHAATSPMHPDVVESMLPYMTEIFGNPSSIHYFGRKGRHAVDEARQSIAESIHAKPNEIVFTSGGTEADNLAIMGTAFAMQGKGKHIITSAIEHHAVLHTCEHLEKQGYTVTYLPVNEAGLISVSDVEAALTPETILVTIMFGNNEVGALQPIKEIGELLQDHQAVFHTDAVQAYGLVDIDVNEYKIDLLSVSAHKINGPKGTGFLFMREGNKVAPLLFGGEQEKKRRAGTENVAGITGLQTAVQLAKRTMSEKKSLYQEFKQTFVSVLKEQDVSFEVNGDLSKSLPHVLNIYFPGTNVESMLVNLDLAGIAASSGSACTAGSIDPSHVLVAMFGKDSDRITSSIRFSFGLGNTIEDIRTAALETAKIVKRLTL
ncbi:cysteine desulfurase family protein [Fredinandcohnia sp. QZ13]|uniref:cysteine desulfurase family protein n=1 Tax=Fredinandcohnia sp. QZ13 TaxID=3073144 RepID=UPI002853030C|nr:cysteine desulfurase family protein [Fredinandcohnia sp. QZ13]MDR4889058.1 cysteine desulfurase family protein [Fredinandcohnia sp. QZ13]